MLDALKAAHDAAAFDEALYAQVDSAQAQVGEARVLERELATLASEVEAAIAARSAAQRESEAAEVAHEASRQRAETAARAAEAARSARDEARVHHAAANIRTHLHAGDQCPVCLQLVDQLPRVKAAPELAAIETAARDAAEHEKTAEHGRQIASNALASATARLAAAATAAEGATARLQRRTSMLAGLLTKLADAVPGASAVVPGPDAALLDWIEQRHAALRAAKHQRDHQAQALHKAATEVSAATLALAHAEGDAKAALARHEQLRTEQGRLQADLAAVVARIHAVTSSDDPRAERQALARRVAQLRAADRSAGEALKTADLEMTMASERLRAAKAAMAQADADVTTAQAQLAQALAEAGFAASAKRQAPVPDHQAPGHRLADEVRAATRTPAQQTALHKIVAAYDDQRALVTHRLAELDPLVAGREVSAEALADAERRRQAAMDAWQTVSQQLTTLEHDVARLQKDLQARTALVAERLALQATLAVTTEMATDLKGDHFQEYLLEEAFRGLVTGASVRMREISNRYTLEWEESEFYVVDHDNAGERRRADTLSGGETFMASLCLALQLSETVLQASGALQMDSLFIDEGFGTLDIDSLSEVTDAIEALGQDGDRLIGVISHRAELTDRLPGLIRIEKGAGESRWVLERVG